MRRWTARWLLLFALLGNWIPVGLALSAAPPPHACCVRKAAQALPCHGMASAEPEQLTLRSTGCCRQDCCRGVTVARWAQPAPAAGVAFAQKTDANIVSPDFDPPIVDLTYPQSTRAPPQSSLA